VCQSYKSDYRSTRFAALPTPKVTAKLELSFAAWSDKEREKKIEIEVVKIGWG